jgi:exodeoxyribonuclease V beta subunit
MTELIPYDPISAFGGGLRALEASAGTGKTYSVTSTVLRLVVEDPELTMDKLLIVTFTKAATAELVDRTRQRLLGGLVALTSGVATDDDLVLQHILDFAATPPARAAAIARVEQAVQQVDEAMISTIHGFCQRVLQQAAFASLVDPGLQVETDQDRLVHQVVDDWAIALQHDADVAFLSALDLLKLTPSLMREIGRAVANEPALYVVPPLVEGDPKALLQEPFARLVDAVEHGSIELCDASTAITSLPQAEGGGKGSKWKPATIDARLAELEDAVGRGELPHGGAWGRLRSDADQTSSGATMPEPMTETAIVRAMDGLGETLTRIEVMVRTQLAAHVEAEVRHRRELAGTASFADLLRELETALQRDTEGHLKTEVRGSYRAVLVDEFQDTDPVQWSILHTLFGEGRHLDVVGDPKQAIYGFRGADLATYTAAVSAADEHATMDTNWRSDRPYVEACNELLGQPGTFIADDSIPYVQVGTPSTHADARLRDGAGAPASGITLTFHRGTGGTPLVKGALDQRAADATAQQIVTVLSDGSKIGVAPVTAGDCAVLVPYHRHAEQVAAALRRRGVPVVLGGGRDVLTTPQAADVADLLAALLAPGDERRLRRVLAGPFGGMDATQLSTLHDAGWDAWFQHADDWRRVWQWQGVAAVVSRAIRDGGAEGRLAAQREGERVLTNLRHLGEVLHRVEQDESLGSHALASWLSAERAAAVGRGSEDRELRLERDADAVRVLTIHTSKGLEFPLVWLPFSWASNVRKEKADTRVQPFSVNDPDDEVVPDRRVLCLHPAAMDEAAGAPERQRLVARKDQAAWESGHRLLYVAMTRAVHRTTIHLAAVDGLPESSLWHVLLRRDHGTGGPGTGLPLPDEDAIIASLESHAEHDAVWLELLAPGRGAFTRYAGRDGTQTQLAARSYDRAASLDVSWGRASYSRLTDGRTAAPLDEAEPSDARDHDAVASAHDADGVPTSVVLTGVSLPLQDLPRGADWGTFVHDVLEHADFDADLPALRATIEHRALASALDVKPEHIDILADGLLGTLATPMGPLLDGLALRDVGDADRIDELGFALGLASVEAGFTLAAVAEAFEAHADDAGHEGVPLAAAARHLRDGGASESAHGLLIGFIDLVLRAPDGRVWIMDYKTNGLGDSDGVGATRTYVEESAHQHPDAVMASMIDHDYLVQAHLYVVAVHRYLRGRLGAAYDYDQHVGGWAYLYVRGMTGVESAVADDGRPHGIAAGRPSRALVEALDAVIGGGA